MYLIGWIWKQGALGDGGSESEASLTRRRVAAGAVSDLGMLGAGTKCASPNSLRAANLLAGFATGGSISSTKDDLNRRTLANGAEPKPRRQRSLVVCAAGEPVCENPVVWDPAGRESPPMDPAADFGF